MQNIRVTNKFGTTFRRVAKNRRVVSDAVSRPVDRDIIFIAGLYQGRGTAYEDRIILRGNESITMRLLAQFGGTVSVIKKENLNPIAIKKKVYFAKKDQYVWVITGARARGFAMTIYMFLSVDKRKQLLENVLK